MGLTMPQAGKDVAQQGLYAWLVRVEGSLSYTVSLNICSSLPVYTKDMNENASRDSKSLEPTQMTTNRKMGKLSYIQT